MEELHVRYEQAVRGGSWGGWAGQQRGVVALNGFLKPDFRAVVTPGTVAAVVGALRTEKKGSLVGGWVSRYGEEEEVKRHAWSEHVCKLKSAMVAHKARLNEAEDAVSTTTKIIMRKQLDLVDFQRRLRS